MIVKEKALKENSKYGYYTWYSSEVLPDETIQIARDILDPKSFAQEYEASWETKSGLVYYAWKAQTWPDGNIDNNVKYDPSKVVYIGMDFNVDPMTATLSHHVLNKDNQLETWCFDAYHLRNSNTRQVSERIITEYPDAVRYVLTPCQSSSNRQTSQEVGRTDLRIIEDVFRENGKLLWIEKHSKNPSLSDRHNVVNARLFHKLIRINAEKKGTKELIKDLEGLAYKEGSSDVDKSDVMRGHISDAFGYSEEKHFDLKSLIQQKTIQATNFI
jgi:hypothetical protein